MESEAADAERTEAANARQLDLIEESKGRAKKSKGRAGEDEFTLEPPEDDEDLAQSGWNPLGARQTIGGKKNNEAANEKKEKAKVQPATVNPRGPPAGPIGGVDLKTHNANHYGGPGASRGGQI